MLQKVIIKNFKSFTNETVIDFTPERIGYLSNTNTYDGVLKGCCFFGPNGSGKTNALNAITLLLDLLFEDSFYMPNEYFSLFVIDEKMHFEYIFLIDDQTISYAFEIDKNKGVTLERLKQNGRILLDVSLHSAKCYIAKDHYYDDMDHFSLLIRRIYAETHFEGYPILEKWRDYLESSVRWNSLESHIHYQEAEQRLISYLKKGGIKRINGFFNECGIPFNIDYGGVEDSKLSSRLDSFRKGLLIIRKEGKKVPFYIASEGDKALLLFLPVFLNVCEYGGFLAVDDYYVGLHNDLEEFLISYFFRHSRGAQLIFASHSTNLLKTSLLRPDQVYSVDFDENGSFLTKFSHFGIRESQKMEKMYLAGAFGGIPNLKR